MDVRSQRVALPRYLSLIKKPHALIYNANFEQNVNHLDEFTSRRTLKEAIVRDAVAALFYFQLQNDKRQQEVIGGNVKVFVINNIITNIHNTIKSNGNDTDALHTNVNGSKCEASTSSQKFRLFVGKF